MIPFNKPLYTGREDQYILASLKSEKISGDGYFGLKCQKWFDYQLGCQKSLLTPSCTQALEMAAILINTNPGDEIIMPSYTFVSTANAFVSRGASIVFVDINPSTMNLDENLIEDAITERTKAIVPVHYAGLSCDMDEIINVARKKNLYVIEDAAQGMMSTYKGKQLGTLGDIGTYSFHETKNFTSGGEGGLLIINNSAFTERAEIIREKGTNRNQFFRGMVDKYTWVDLGSSYLPSEIQAAYLWGQLEYSDLVIQDRVKTWNAYYEAFSEMAFCGQVELPVIPDFCTNNAHMFYLKCKNLAERTVFLRYMKEKNITAVFHYVPLHSSPAGKRFGRFHGEDKFTTKESERLVRLPLWFGMDDNTRNYVVDCVKKFFNNPSLYSSNLGYV